MAFVHKLHKCRRNAGADVASASFLVLVLIFSSVLPVSTRHAGPAVDASAIAAAAPSLSQSPRPRGQEEQADQEETTTTSCPAALRSLPDAAARCRYLRSPHPPCAPRAYVPYLRAFYCAFGRAPALGAAALALWLLLLFYLLGDTASRYFCASLEGLSAALRLPPAIAGATLLSLGNGAPDVLSSVVAFASSDAGDVGLSGVLGGALFVSSVVAGVVAIAGAGAAVERSGFLRDVGFLLLALCCLLAVLRSGAVTVWAAAAFLSLYAAYVLLVWTTHCCASAAAEPDPEDGNMKPAAAGDLACPLLADDAPAPPVSSSSKDTSRSLARRALDLLRWPLDLPRRLTIPDISAHRWSKPHAVASTLLAPLLVGLATSPTSPAVLLSSALLGLALAAAAARSTDAAAPPASLRGRLPWLAGGFLMSVLWSYLLARELVSLLVSIGLVAGVKASVLGATVLAWGNSLGDLAADVAMAARGGARGGAQTAVSGCYAGPAFNTVVGLGLSLTMAAAGRFPTAYAVPADASAYQAAGFLAAALVWALVVLPARGMRLDRVLGGGLIALYLAFLAVRLATLGAVG
ncbi:hypothetical protein U9M48_037587 [Paspalum notatum var. saurae]|uniref:Sodium/calcium exchanger membrane region domain-containing protein n=1 Tax=Paspalum notatum var. saurae TaxID=547442 RepID=A0AAQ3UFW5_PASNO